MQMSYDLDYGMKNDYEPAENGDGGQGQFGAVSPSNWRVPGTSPVGEKSYAGAADGGDEPWFSEAISTVSLDLNQANEAFVAFTASALTFKIAEFGASKPYQWPGDAAGKDELIASIGYAKVLESTVAQLGKAWAKIHPEPKKEAKE